LSSETEIVEYGEHRVIVGSGLDEYLEDDRNIVLLDDYYADVYGDYVFLGYEALAASFMLDRGDLVELLAAVTALDKGPSIVVCGDNGARCLYALAGYDMLHGRDPSSALGSAARALSKLYGGAPQRYPQIEASLLALWRGFRLLGVDRFTLVVGLASSYNYGMGSLHYGESVSWASMLGVSDVVFMAVLLHFLVEGPGDPGKLLKVRLEALGEDNLKSLLGEAGGTVLEALADYAERGEGEAASFLELIEVLEPGEGSVVHVALDGDTVVVYCKPDTHGTPGKKCVRLAGRAADVIERWRLPLKVKISLEQPPLPLRT